MWHYHSRTPVVAVVRGHGGAWPGAIQRSKHAHRHAWAVAVACLGCNRERRWVLSRYAMTWGHSPW